jgi:hypothetical protein
MRVFAPLVWLAVVQIFVVTLLASSPELHECFHPDSHDSDHHCLATDFQAGFIDQPVIVPVDAPSFAPVSFEIVAFPASARHSLPLHLCGSLLEHGPPSPV